MLKIRKRSVPTFSPPKEAYEKLYREQGIRHLDSFYKWLLRILQPAPGKKLLDVACGEGRLTHWAVLAGLEGHGLDFSEKAIRRAKEKSWGSFLVGDGEALPFKSGEFDYITSIGSIEHYVQPLPGVQEITRLLAPAGRALILLPNTFGLLHNVWTALRTGRPGMDDQPIQRYATAREWQDLLEAGGLQVLKTIKYEREWPTSRADAAWYLCHPKNLVRLLLTPLIPTNWAGCFVFVCARSQGSTGMV